MQTEEDYLALENLLLGILRLAEEPLREYDLVRLLQQRGVPYFAERDLGQDLDLFQAHFLLFHLLYRLRDRLWQRGEGDVEIHCLGIRLRPLPQGQTQLPSQGDGLREYYLDFSHLEEATAGQVRQMLEDFWSAFGRYQAKDGAWETLGLSPGASREQIKQRYRELAQAHHPDKGGSQDSFILIQQAAQALLG